MTTFGNGTIMEDLMIVFKFFITLFSFGLCVFSIVTAKEIEKEKNDFFTLGGDY